MTGKNKALREGFSTGACASAAAKAACILLKQPNTKIDSVELLFPDGHPRKIRIYWARSFSKQKAEACVIKDAGDDPDVTDGAEIIAQVHVFENAQEPGIEIAGGKGVGTVTKPGLAVEPGKPAINPVPQKMIKDAVYSVLDANSCRVKVTITVPKGEEIAQKTLNRRLGIVGGISILGTTGIVKPISEAAWCATISVSMDVALAAGIHTICLSTGRSSETAAMERFKLKEEAFISMGDYVGFSLKEAAKRPFKKVILACQWSKLVKMAMGWDQTHVRFGPLDPKDAIKFMKDRFGLSMEGKDINTVRQLFAILGSTTEGKDVIDKVCEHAYDRLRRFLPQSQRLQLVLVSYEKKIIVSRP